MLLGWAKQLTHTEEEQRQLVEQTIARAAYDPFTIADEPIDRALLSLMLQIARSDMVIGPALDERFRTPAEFRKM
jgi:hypothetical protein